MTGRAFLNRILLAIVAAIGAPAVRAADCYDQAGSFYQLSPALLRAIAAVESGGRLNAIGHNRNGTEDLCAMQINSAWLPTLARFGILRHHLLTHECTCVHAGAWILAGEMQSAGYSWRAVGQYHTGNNPRRAAEGHAYAWRVFQKLERVK